MVRQPVRIRSLDRAGRDAFERSGPQAVPDNVRGNVREPPPSAFARALAAAAEQQQRRDRSATAPGSAANTRRALALPAVIDANPPGRGRRDREKASAARRQRCFGGSGAARRARPASAPRSATIASRVGAVSPTCWSCFRASCLGPFQKKAKFRGSLDWFSSVYFNGFRRDAAMGLFVVLFSCVADT